MPITYLFKLPITIDQIPQFRETLEKRIQSLKPRQLNQFQVQAVMFQATSQASIQQFLHSDFSSTCFSLIEPQSSSHETKVLTADIGLASLQRRILDGEKKALQLDLIGSAFKLGDFYIKIGAVTQNSSNRGLLIEISYCASNNNDAYGVIIEFVDSHLGLSNSHEMLTSFVKKKQPHTNYTPEDTIIQYYEHFNSMRSQTAQIRSH
ncbi:Mediator of RNA polymerase II transcription subunit 20 [Brachionus plicatilis]|uniref:Mediator of RNA polymerase II transcription subunit 20 n=1 Tax=Brachionus plicatilis TaxID=10195 RepID=A0A3M7R6U1_BRAPC|nr:Mediator of RNA polymerase II transcription subunit 20 [Brachionus plicatilis]